MIQRVKLQMDRVRYLSLPDAGHLRHLLSQHADILDAVERGCAQTAAGEMTGHLQEVLQTVRRLNETRPDLFES